MLLAPRISLILPSRRGSESPAFIRAKESVQPQLSARDELIVVVDVPPHNDKGAWARNQAMTQARGTHIMFLDDDDHYLPGALEAARRGIEEAPERPLLFRVRYPASGGLLKWKQGDGIEWGEISTLGIVVPNRKCLPDWTPVWLNHESQFLIDCEQKLGLRTVLRPEVIAEALGA